MDTKNELIRSAMRIKQEREEPIDHFVKIMCIYKGICDPDQNILEVMK